MKTRHFLVLIGCVIIGGCASNQQNIQTPIPPTPVEQNTNTETIDESGPDRSTICGWVCDNIQNICKDDIENASSLGRNLQDGILEVTNCYLQCETNFDEKTIGCISDADNCSQIMDGEPFCIDDTEEDVPNDSVPDNCVSACNNYVDCVQYWDWISQQDKDDAFDSCMQICPWWTDAVRRCVVNTKINEWGDCLTQTRCVLWF